ncbi:hypothetical protein ACODT3_01940 [Streptomyces sp. 4.24]|uniref:hypothetical protein n=1 Tax=Streptomyces tritrimontium TaxID=3406573 RepID=UPI003BB6AF3C
MTTAELFAKKSASGARALRGHAARTREDMVRTVEGLATGKTGRAAALARTHRTALITAAGVLAAALLARRSRRA